MQKTVKDQTRVESLDKVKKGMDITINSLPEGIIKAQLIRLGLTIGARVICLQRLPGGTIVLKKNRQEIAIGYELAKKINFCFTKRLNK